MRYFLMPLAAALALGAAVLPATAQSSRKSTPLETIPGDSGVPAPAAAGQSKGELLAAKQFGWLDADHDGFLSRDEVALFPRLRDAFEQADQDHDGRVSFEEIRNLALQRRGEKEAARSAAAGKSGGTAAPAAPIAPIAPVAPAAPAASPAPAPEAPSPAETPAQPASPAKAW